MKIIHGEFVFPCSNKSRTLDAPTPTNISTKSAPLKLKKGASASPATALARSVFPVPGGPTNNAPLGIFAPNFSNNLGCFKKSITSLSSSFASTQPATSLNVIFSISGVQIFALLLPKLKIPFIPPAPDCILLRINIHTAIINSQGSIFRK